MENGTIMIDGMRYYADRPSSCRGCFFWKNRNTKLKAMVESYRTRAPQAKETQPRESAREKLDALVKDTAAKVAADKPKSKTKSKKDPER